MCYGTPLKAAVLITLTVLDRGLQVHGHVLVPLFQPVVLLGIMEIITSDNNGLVHIHLGDDSSAHMYTDGDLIF